MLRVGKLRTPAARMPSRVRGPHCDEALPRTKRRMEDVMKFDQSSSVFVL